MSSPGRAARDDIQRLEREIQELRTVLDQHHRELAVQLTRIAQVQADLDLIRAAWTKVRAADVPYSGSERRRKNPQAAG